MAKEATARIKINKLLEAAGWRFFSNGNKPANIRLESSVMIKSADLDALGDNFEKTSKGFIDFLLLGCVAMDDLRVTAGVDAYPRLGDRIYAAPHRFIALLPRLMERVDDAGEPVVLNLGAIGRLCGQTRCV